MDPLHALAEIIVGWHRTTKIVEWVKLVFQMTASGCVTMCFVTGSTLLTTKSWPLSVGSGLVSSGIVLAVFLRRSPLLRGMMFVFPASEAKSEIETDVQVLSR